jgi:hypothetical protein
LNCLVGRNHVTNLSAMLGGHQPKYQRTTSGRHNQNPTTGVSTNEESYPLDPSTESDEEHEWNSRTYHDSLKVDFEQELSDNDTGNDDIEEWNNEWDIDLGHATPGFQARLILMAARLGDDPCDEDWIPAQLRAKRKKQEREKKCTYQYCDLPLLIKH